MMNLIWKRKCGVLAHFLHWDHSSPSQKCNQCLKGHRDLVRFLKTLMSVGEPDCRVPLWLCSLNISTRAEKYAWAWASFVLADILWWFRTQSVNAPSMQAMIILTWQLFRGSYLEVRQCCLDWNVAAITVRDGISTAARRGGEKG